MPIDERFKEGLRLFKEGQYFESHEVIEDLWLETPEDDPWRDLYKGVIQAAAAIYQFKRGILSGALGLYRSSIKYLEAYRPEAMGLQTGKLIEDMNICFEELARAWGRGHIVIDMRKLPHPVFDFKE
jgi:predicted metal-dependent hydrolase